MESVANIEEHSTLSGDADQPQTPPSPGTLSAADTVTSSEGHEELEDAMERRYIGGYSKSRANWCYRCETMQTKLIRHMMAKHRDAPEMHRYLLATDLDPAVQKKKRKAICRDIANRSNHRYNERLVALGERGTPLPLKRSRRHKVTEISHVVCPACKGLVTRKYFGSHARTCTTRSLPAEPGATTKATFLLPPLDTKYDALKTHVFPKMTKDEISYIAQTDGLILQYGRRFFQTHQSEHQRYYVSSQMRTLADLLLRFRKVEPARVKTLADCLDPTNFNGLCAVVREWCGLDVTNGRCRAGSVPRRLCKSLKVCSKITWFEAIKDKDLSIEQQLDIRNKHERFMALMECDWTMEVNGAADKSLKIQKMDKKDKMPLSRDVEKFFNAMTEKIKLADSRLRDGHDGSSYVELTKACIAYLIIFNCRRPSEVVYATVANYEATLKTKSDGMAVFTVAALKNDVKVPIIVTPVVRSAIDALLNHRLQLQVKGDLLFGKLDGTAYNGGNLINAFKADIVLEKPDDFSANGFRHYLATESQLDPELKRHMPKFLGHTLSTHQRFYEMPMSDIHLDVIGPSLIRFCRVSDTDDRTAATSSSSHLPSSINYDNPTPCTSKETPTDFCLGIVPLDIRDDRNKTSESDSDTSIVIPSSLPTTAVKTGMELRKRTSRPVAVETESELDNDDQRRDPDFQVGTTNVEATDRGGNRSLVTTTSSDTDSDMLVSPLRVIRQKNKWTTPERKELYDGLPRVMLGIERAERGDIRSVWENSNFIRRRHSLQTMRIEVSKHFTRKKRIATPDRKSILDRLSLSE